MHLLQIEVVYQLSRLPAGVCRVNGRWVAVGRILGLKPDEMADQVRFNFDSPEALAALPQGFRRTLPLEVLVIYRLPQGTDVEVGEGSSSWYGGKLTISRCGEGRKRFTLVGYVVSNVPARVALGHFRRFLTIYESD